MLVDSAARVECSRRAGAAATAQQLMAGIVGGYPHDMKPTLSGPAGHPLHPFVAPVPIGAFVASLIFDILTRTRPGELPWLVDGAWWLIGIGLLGAGFAALFGVLDLSRIPRRTRPFKLALAHLTLNLVVAGLLGIGYAWRATDHVDLGQTRWGQLALSGVAVALLAVAVWLGQTLTYRHGTRVHHPSRDAGDRSG